MNGNCRENLITDMAASTYEHSKTMDLVRSKLKRIYQAVQAGLNLTFCKAPFIKNFMIRGAFLVLIAQLDFYNRLLDLVRLVLIGVIAESTNSYIIFFLK